jgi:hypothetical protein
LQLFERSPPFYERKIKESAIFIFWIIHMDTIGEIYSQPHPRAFNTAACDFMSAYTGSVGYIEYPSLSVGPFANTEPACLFVDPCQSHHSDSIYGNTYQIKSPVRLLLSMVEYHIA